jgi:phosphotriesterase-related protein
MRPAEFTGKAQAVLGLIDAEALGVTLPHEHIHMSIQGVFKEPSEASERALAYQPINLENLHWIRLHIENHLDNLVMPDEQVLIKEIMFYKMAGGDTIVDLTGSSSMGRDPLGLVRIARATGVNIIVGTGIYEVYTGYEDHRTEEDLTEEMVREITVGIGDTGVRAGIIGEIGCSWPLSENQRKVLRVCARAQKRTGAAINIHPPLKAPSHKEHEDAILEVIKTLGDAGADLSRTVISHMDLACLSLPFRCKLADTGCYVEYDVFGWEGYPPRDIYPADMLNDAQRVNEIMQLIAKGYGNQILVAGDHGMKMMFRTYGGWGYDHILTNVVPLMRYKGMSDEQIHTLLVENPKRVLAFAAVR